MAHGSGHWDVLAAVPSAVRNSLLGRSTRRDVGRGKHLWRQGDVATGVAVLTHGKVMSQYESRGGRIGTIGFWRTADFIGLGDLALRATRQHTVLCLDRSSFQLIDFETLDEYVRTSPDFASALLQALATRLSWVTKLALGLETSSARERVSTALLALGDHFGVDHQDGVQIDLHLTHELLAAIAGVTRQFANTILGELREQGLVANGRPLVLTDLAALERLATN